MKSPDSRRPGRASGAPARVVIAINPPGEYTQALDAAARLAASLEARLEAVLVEDPELLEIARMPATRVVDSAGRERNLDDQVVQRAWRLERRRLDEALRRRVAGLNIRFSVRSVQGRFVPEVMSVDAQVDVLLLAHPRSVSGELSSSERGWLRAPAGRRGAPASPRRARPVWVLFDGSPASERALELGAQLAADYGSLLLVLHPEPLGGEGVALDRVQVLIGSHRVPLTLVPVRGDFTQALAAVRRPEGCALVLAPRAAVNARSMSSILEALAARSYPLVLVA